MPTKKASSDINNAESPRNETTRLSALATGFRLRTTAPAKITVSTAKIQNRKGDIFQATDEHGSNTDVNRNPKIRDYPCQSVAPTFFRSIWTSRALLRRTLCHPERSEGSLERKQRKLDIASFGRSLAFARDDHDYFFSFHLRTTPCITPPISRSLSL